MGTRNDRKRKSSKSKLLYENIGRRVERWQRLTADVLNRKTRLWSAQRLTVLLISFCAVFGGCCMFLLAEAVMQANGPPGTYRLRLQSKPISGFADTTAKSITNNTNR